MTSNIKNNMLKLAIGMSLASSVSMLQAQDNLKQHIEKEGFKFVQQIQAPAQMTGWAGHIEQSPATVFISNDQKYYIVGTLFDAQGNNLTVDALDRYVKKSVLEDVWQSLEHATWIQDGQTSAEKIVYVFSDPNCPYCHTFWKQARPWVESGKVQLRHIIVAVIRLESKGQAATLLMAKNPQQTFNAFHRQYGQKKLIEQKTVPVHVEKTLEQNQALMDKYEFFATPVVLWKNKQGELQSVQGMPKSMKDVFE
ncbi:thiol:disulfide interchange protein DsbG [Acinetobacter sp. YH12120]|uniref:thiol:disulfide interchange protein DsbG n=1 Tax=Acinetobacter sp. YH12120 TaxID=2601107 RepID=UPI0015D265FF|nr:thiol:disulfide interchange protein DsbG [Acinetobacter sp. YH12120]